MGICYFRSFDNEVDLALDYRGMVYAFEVWNRLSSRYLEILSFGRESIGIGNSGDLCKFAADLSMAALDKNRTLPIVVGPRSAPKV